MNPLAPPPTWKVLQLADLAADEPNAITDGPFGSKLKTEHYTSSGPRVVRLQNIGDGVFVYERAHIAPSHFSTLQRHQVFPGDLVIAALGERLPRAAVVPKTLGPAIVKADCIRFKPNTALVSAKYLLYVLISPQLRHQAGTIIHGVGRPRLNQGEVKSLQIPVAPRAEQDRIVAEVEKQFTRLDAGVEALRRLQAHLRRYRAAVLKAACEGTLSESERRWSRVRVSEVADVRLGRQRSPSNRPGKYARPYLRAANVTWAGVDISDVKEMDFTPAEFERYVLRPGDVLLSEASGSAGEVGKPVVFRGEVPDCCFQNTLIRVRSRGPIPAFLRYRFLHDAWSGRFASASKGVGIHHLGAERLSSLEILLPPANEQERLVEILDRRFSVCDAHDAAAAAARARASRLRASVLAAAFGGRLSS